MRTTKRQYDAGAWSMRATGQLVFILLIAVLPLVPAAQRTQLVTRSEAGMTAPRLLIIEQAQRVQLPTTSYGGAVLFWPGLLIATVSLQATQLRHSTPLLYLPRRLRLALYQLRKLEGG